MQLVVGIIMNIHDAGNGVINVAEHEVMYPRNDNQYYNYSAFGVIMTPKLSSPIPTNNLTDSARRVPFSWIST